MIPLKVIKAKVMYELFEDGNMPTFPVVRLGSIDLLKRTYQRETLRVIDYFGSRVSAIKNDHILNRIITTSCPPLGSSIAQFYSLARMRAPIVADNMQFTYSANYGKVFDGIFYGGAKEIILLDDSDFDPEYVYKNWRDVDAVKVITHPFTDYKLIPPFGQQYTRQDGVLTVLSVNIAMLLVQFKAWADYRFMVNDPNKLELGSTHFIRMHVIPNILRTHVEFVFYNRLKDIFYTLPNYESINKLPFPVIDYRKIADSIASEYCEKFRDKGNPYPKLFQNIPAIFKDNMSEVLMMPDMAKTKQVWWALFLARLEDQFFAIHLLGDEGINDNKKYYNKFLSNCKFFTRDNTFKSVLSNSIYAGYLTDMRDLSSGRT